MPSKPLTGDEIYQLPLPPKDDERATEKQEQHVQVCYVGVDPLDKRAWVLITHTSEGKRDGN